MLYLSWNFLNKTLSFIFFKTIINYRRTCPLYACKFIPERTDEQRKLDAQVKAFKEKGAKLKKERQKARVKFRCPYIDPLTNTQCSQTYATIKYPGVLKHLRLCSLRAFQGNEKRSQDYVRDKRISLES